MKKTIDVNRPFVFVTVGVPLPELDGEIRGVDGVSVPVPEHRRPVWARLIQVFSETSYEAAVREDGGFSFRGIPSGLYLLVIISGEDILVVRQVAVKLGIQTLSFADK